MALIGQDAMPNESIRRWDIGEKKTGRPINKRCEMSVSLAGSSSSSREWENNFSRADRINDHLSVVIKVIEMSAPVMRSTKLIRTAGSFISDLSCLTFTADCSSSMRYLPKINFTLFVVSFQDGASLFFVVSIQSGLVIAIDIRYFSSVFVERTNDNLLFEWSLCTSHTVLLRLLCHVKLLSIE
jgi:hypothetical protein